MAGKGIKRREKNYRAAHGGGHTRLPPPPDPSSADVVPSKLRKLMSLAGSGRQSSNRVKGNTGIGTDKGVTSTKRKRGDLSSNAHAENRDGVPETSMSEKKKKKRKVRKAVDLRFEAVAEPAVSSKKKERRKQHLLAKKKKHKQSESDEDMKFPGHEEIRFGDVVLAPPKLNVAPKLKAFKTTHDASRERLRLQAVDAYRQRKGWASRPGVKLPPPIDILRGTKGPNCTCKIES
ncbi:hypothetical protein OROGR_003914 [Orobanche gracilis]